MGDSCNVDGDHCCMEDGKWYYTTCRRKAIYPVDGPVVYEKIIEISKICWDSLNGDGECDEMSGGCSNQYSCEIGKKCPIYFEDSEKERYVCCEYEFSVLCKGDIIVDRKGCGMTHSCLYRTGLCDQDSEYEYCEDGVGDNCMINLIWCDDNGDVEKEEYRPDERISPESICCDPNHVFHCNDWIAEKVEKCDNYCAFGKCNNDCEVNSVCRRLPAGPYCCGDNVAFCQDGIIVEVTECPEQELICFDGECIKDEPSSENYPAAIGGMISFIAVFGIGLIGFTSFLLCSCLYFFLKKKKKERHKYELKSKL